MFRIGGADGYTTRPYICHTIVGEVGELCLIKVCVNTRFASRQGQGLLKKFSFSYPAQIFLASSSIVRFAGRSRINNQVGYLQCQFRNP